MPENSLDAQTERLFLQADLQGELSVEQYRLRRAELGELARVLGHILGHRIAVEKDWQDANFYATFSIRAPSSAVVQMAYTFSLFAELVCVSIDPTGPTRRPQRSWQQRMRCSR